MEISTVTILGNNQDVSIINHLPEQPLILLKTKIVLLEVAQGETYDIHLEVNSKLDTTPIFHRNYSIKTNDFNQSECLYNDLYALSFTSELPLFIKKDGLYFLKVFFFENGIKKEHQISFFVK